MWEGLTLEGGRIPKALLSARWLKCSSVLGIMDSRHVCACAPPPVPPRPPPPHPPSPEAAVGGGHQVVEDVEGGLGVGPSAHPQLLQQHRLERGTGGGFEAGRRLSPGARYRGDLLPGWRQRPPGRPGRSPARPRGRSGWRWRSWRWSCSRRPPGWCRPPATSPLHDSRVSRSPGRHGDRGRGPKLT